MLGYQNRITTTADPLSDIVGEDFATENPLDAARWVRIYSELVALHEDQAPRESTSAGRRQLEGTLHALRSRLEDWRSRHLELAGMDFDPYSRMLTVAGHPYTLTRREAQLLEFLLEHPGQYFTSEVLIREAWSDARLHPEQVRTYIVRLRRKLDESSAPARVVNRPRLGYSLSVERSVLKARQRPAS